MATRWGGRLYALRTHHGLARAAFASKIGLKKDALYRLEACGQQTTRGDQPTIHAIARMFDVQPVWLYAGSAAPQRMWPDWWRPQ